MVGLSIDISTTRGRLLLQFFSQGRGCADGGRALVGGEGGGVGAQSVHSVFPS